MSVLSLGKRPGSVGRPLRAKNSCPPARRPGAGVRTPAVPSAAGRPRAARLEETEFAEWPGRAARTARGGSLRAGAAPGTAAGRPGRARRAGRPERVLRLVQPGETARSQPLAAGRPGQAQSSGRGPAGGLVPLPRQAPPPEQVPPPGPVARPAPRRGARPDRWAQPDRWAPPGGGAQPGREVQPRRAARPGRAHRPGSAASPRPRTRLTRRGRLVLWALAGLLVAALLTPVLLVASAGAQAANHGASPAQVRAGMQHVVVQPGQSLWSIAEQAEPAADPRTVIQQIIQYNALGSDVVAPGESLWVPRG